MKYVWLMLLVLGVAAGAAIFSYLRTRSAKVPVDWVAGTNHLRMLRSYREERSRTRTTLWVGATLLVSATVSLAVSAGMPVERKVEHPALASRDIVLCLDASGSMLPYDGQILRAFSEMVDSFEGERISLQLWSAQSITKFPLSDDYDLAQDVLHEAATVIDHGYLGPQGDDYVLVSHELADYLDGIEAPDGERISSLVGDSLATCVLGFDHLNEERSRTVILATDNEVMGPQIYTTAEAVQFATDQDVEVIALYPGEGGVIKAEGEQLKTLVEGAGGSFYNAEDPASIGKIVAEIEAQQLVDLTATGTTVEIDHPKSAMVWSAWSVILLLALAAVRRL